MVTTACRRDAVRRGMRGDVVVTVAPVELATHDASSDVKQDMQFGANTLEIPVMEGGPCTVDDQCASTHCFNQAEEAQYSRALQVCASARRWRQRRHLGTCTLAACDRDSQCPQNQRCGTWLMVPVPQRMCLPAGCRSDVECPREDGGYGRCVPYLAGRTCEPGGWNCSYPEDQCDPTSPTRRCHSQNGTIAYCIPVDGRFQCVNE
jgi:hypothetical protein